MSPAAAAELRVARLTVDQVHAMLDAGILPESEPIELIDGMLVYKDRSAHGDAPMTIGRLHNLVVKLLARLDADLVPRGCHMQTRGPLTLTPHDEPEPDGVILRGKPRDYADRLPAAGDADVVIEVADASLANDRSTKLALYARAGIRQYIIVNVRDSVLEIHEEPSREGGSYARTTLRRAGDNVAFSVGAGEPLEIEAARILP